MSEEYTLHVKEIHKSFGKTNVLRNVSLRVNKGESLGFLGPNGAGKTTLIRIILGLVRPDRGSIYLNGYSLRSDFKQAIKHVGAVVENPRFYEGLSAYKNLQLIHNLHPEVPVKRIGEVLEMVGLSHRADDKVGTFSLGMKQRLGLARALFTQPTIVFLDEPLNGLDPQGMMETRKMICNLQQEQGISFFITSHLLSEIEQVCDNIAVIKEGEIIRQGSLEKLLERNYEIVDVHTDDMAKTVPVLRQAGFVQHITVKKDHATVEIDCGGSVELNRHLVNKNIPVRYIVPRKTTLEELFVELTQGGETGDGPD
ncbi:ABC transporter ATP-binding protein [Dethiobacter alkaliphilus]|uniref:ABC transporter ATP-binding protein n=1 Tax=Dethiobacter alkaliphilus TaxID=427926 RepID=UPI002226422A|nr:ABC transporter ATP-binding protein [Dethiobacter alkaliphilus]MCW3489887.1 ABC transporter ATP-binding protein [Dethiobacter alkaliphilus]